MLLLAVPQASAYQWQERGPEEDPVQHYKPDPDARYIDYENGDDKNAGTRDAPWKHHPWDANAGAKAASAAGVHTFLFRKGVTYRGLLVPSESGDSDHPIVLTVDPGWGDGAAVLAGSAIYKGGWKPCDAKIDKTLPEASRKKAWCRSVNVASEPRLLWEEHDSGITRIPVARSPNWEIVDRDDPRSQWYEIKDVFIEMPLDVDSSQGFSAGDDLFVQHDATGHARVSEQDKHPVARIIDVKQAQLQIEIERGHERQLKPGDIISNGKTRAHILQTGDTHSIIRRIVDTENLVVKKADAYAGATIWAERRSDPKADAALVISSDPGTHSLNANFHRAIGDGPERYDRYYLEGLPEFLDSPGEYLYQEAGNHSGVIVLRLPENRDPNTTMIEAAISPVILDIHNQSNIRIIGLSFMFNNQVAPGSQAALNAPLHASAIQIRGDVNNIEIANCRFSYLSAGIVAFPEDMNKPSKLDNIVIRDSLFEEIDGSAVALGNGQLNYSYKNNGSRLIHVSIRDNTLQTIGYRTLANFGIGSHGDGIQVAGGEVVEVAGNTVNRVWGSGISSTLGSGYELGKVERPFLRGLVYGNTVVDSLLGAQDGGGINSWMGGPAYLFNNTIGNPVGCMYSRFKTSTQKDWYRRGCYGVGIYLDGQYKGYVFNNIAWGKNNNVNDRIYNSAAFNEAMGFMHTVFNNTFYRFGTGLHKGMFQDNRNYYLGNLLLDMGVNFIQHEPAGTIDYSTLAFSRNLFYGEPSYFGQLGTRRSDRFQDIGSWRNAMRARGLMSYDTGRQISESPVQNAPDHDFRLTRGSPAIDAGVKVFVPWALYGVVGEWHFLRRNRDPSIINGENINMDSAWLKRDMFHLISRNDLDCVNTRATDFQTGLLEDWIPGALNFDGKTRSCTLSESNRAAGEVRTGQGRETVDMSTNNFLVETVVAVNKTGKTRGLLAKRDQRGYSLGLDAAGRVCFTVDYGEQFSERCSKGPIDDSKWHHVLVEVDRSEGRGISIYLDGELANGAWTGTGMQAASISNASELVVGKSDEGFFSGRIDFLRIARGTLAQAETNIKELYAWEFNGPFLRDHLGRPPQGVRDAGAMEYGSGQPVMH